MTLPNTPFTVVPNGADAPSAPAGASTPASPPDAPQLLDIAHVDYNLHPLKVTGLDHFVEQPDGNERFRIS